MDYILIRSKWRNAIRDVTNDLECEVPTDHIPLKTTIHARLKANYWKREERKKRYEHPKCEDRERAKFNRELDMMDFMEAEGEEQAKAMMRTAAAALPKKETTFRERVNTPKVDEVVNRKREAWRMSREEKARELPFELKRVVREEQKRLILESVGRNLDLKDKWLGIRKLKKAYYPSPTISKTRATAMWKRGSRQKWQQNS